MHTDIDKGAEVGDVGDDARKLHSLGEIGGFIDTFSEGKQLELGAGVATGFGELSNDILEGRETDFIADILIEVDVFASLSVADQGGHVTAEIGGHLFDQGITLRVNRGGVERVSAATNAEKSCGLFKRDIAEACDFFEIFTGFERAVFGAVGNDVRGDSRVESGDVAEQLTGRGIYFHTDAVDTADYGVIESGFEQVLIDVMLVLADADAFGIELH